MKRDALLRESLELITRSFNDLDLGGDVNAVFRELREFLVKHEQEIDDIIVS